MKDKTYIVTPTLLSSNCDLKNRRSYFKMDCMQPSGSFKLRGMDHLCRSHYTKGKRTFVASSGGNAGLSLAYVGKEIGAEIKVIVPKSTPSFMIEKIRVLDAEVEVFGEAWDEADQKARSLAKELNAFYVSPFDDPLLWEGHSSMIDECAGQMERPDKLVVSVGGGGLLCGVLTGMKRNGWEDTEVITTETFGATSFHDSYHANKVVELSEINTIATSLGAKKITEKALELATEFKVTPFRMSDEDTLSACRHFYKEFDVLVEPACGAALSVPYLHSEMNRENERVLVIVCGGVNVNMEMLELQS